MNNTDDKDGIDPKKLMWGQIIFFVLYLLGVFAFSFDIIILNLVLLMPMCITCFLAGIQYNTVIQYYTDKTITTTIFIVTITFLIAMFIGLSK